MNSTPLCDIETCERTQWLVGATGHCNTTTGVCECPPGFGGLYILSNTNDCHVSDGFKYTVNLVTYATALSAVGMAAIALIKLSWEIYHVYRPKVFPENSNSEDCSNFTKTSQQNRKVLTRKLWAVGTLLGYLIYGFCEVYRTMLLLDEMNAFADQIPTGVILVYCIGVCCATAAIFSFLYIYTTSLPKGGQMAAVLGIAYDAERYNTLLNWVFKYNTLLCVGMIVIVNIGYAAKISDGYMYNYALVELVVQTVVCIDLFGVACFVHYMNVPMYKKIIKSSDDSKITWKLKAAIFRCDICIYMGSLSILSFCTCIVLVSIDHRLGFILFTFVAINLQLSTILGSCLLGWDFVKAPTHEETGQASHRVSALLRVSRRSES